jgi:hypothetical protein
LGSDGPARRQALKSADENREPQFALAVPVVYAAAMRNAFVAVLLVLILAGCATDEDDRAFFQTGWLRPEKGAEQRLDTR